MVVATATDQGFVWIEQPQPFNWKYYIGSVDVTSDVIEAETTKIATEAIGSFKLTLNNNAGTYDTYTGNETFTFYADLSGASTKKFHGKIEKVGKKYGGYGHTLEIEGSHVAVSLLDRIVTRSFEKVWVSQILKNIVDAYLPGFTYTNTDTVETKATVNWSNKPFLDCVKDLCKLGNCDFYVDDDRDFHFFESGSKLCTTEAVVGTSNGNMVSIDGLGTNITEIKNRIVVYGENDGLTIIATAEDLASQSEHGVKEKTIKDTDISTYQEAKDRAEAELAVLKDTNTKGSTESLWLLGLSPGEKMWISIPDKQIHDKYVIRKITHRFPDLFTECEIYEETMRLPQIFKKRIEQEMSSEKIDNPFGMSHTYDFTFDDNTNLSHANTLVREGVLMLDGASPGTCTSTSRTASSNITSICLKIKGQDYGASTFEISADNGSTWETVLVNELHDVISTGKKLRWRVTLVADSDNTYPQINTLSLGYK